MSDLHTARPDGHPRCRFLHISDIHLGAFPEDPVRRADVALAFERALSLALEKPGDGRAVDFVVIAGDLFDKKSVSPDVLRLHARPPLERLRDAGIPVYAIEGNHDEPVHGARHSWVSYLGSEGLLVPLRPVLTPGLSLPDEASETRPAALVRAPGGVLVVGLGYLGPLTEPVLAELPRVLPDLGADAEAPAIVLLHAMPSPVSPAEPGTFTEPALDGLAGRHVYLALGHGHRRYLRPPEAHERPQTFVAASPGSLEYVHESDFHLDDARGAFLVTVRDDGRFAVEAWDTLKRPRVAVRLSLASLVVPSDLPELGVTVCGARGLEPGAILGLLLDGEPPFSRAQLPLAALERQVREAFRPASLDIRFTDEVALPHGDLVSADGTAGRTAEDDVTAVLRQLLKERLPVSVPLGQIDRLANFLAPRLAPNGAWRDPASDLAADGGRGSELPDALACLLELVAGDDARWVLDEALTEGCDRDSRRGSLEARPDVARVSAPSPVVAAVRSDPA
jgi:DNA repair exonuclease SbcCD nuclease subunit